MQHLIDAANVENAEIAALGEIAETAARERILDDRCAEFRQFEYCTIMELGGFLRQILGFVAPSRAVETDTDALQHSEVQVRRVALGRDIAEGGHGLKAVRAVAGDRVE
ncbi:hypothetical protein P5P81_05815 [Tritonibacter mobilis]|nr:hypothetical protein [Tritonibacter mobilis]